MSVMSTNIDTIVLTWELGEKGKKKSKNPKANEPHIYIEVRDNKGQQPMQIALAVVGLLSVGSPI